MFRVFNFHSCRLRTKRTKFGPDENFPLYGNHEHIVESVDSICRDSVDMQNMIIQRISQNLKNSQVRSLYNNVSFIFNCSLIPRPSVPHVLRVWEWDYFECFMTYNTPSSTKASQKYRTSHEIFFFLLVILFSDRLNQPITFFSLVNMHKALATKCNYYSRLLN